MNNLMLDSMSTMDIIMVGLVVLSIVIGAVRGFVKEAMSLITWVAASVVSALYFQQIGDTYFSGIQVVMLRYALASVLLAMGTLIIGGVINYCISSIIKKTGFNLVDRMIGAIFGCARGVFVLIIGVVIGITFTHLQSNAWHHSVFVPMLMPSATWLKDRIHVPEKLKEVLESNPSANPTASAKALEELESATKHTPLAPLPANPEPASLPMVNPEPQEKGL